MNAMRRLHERGQSLWLDNITRDLLNSGTLARYVAEFSVTGLTSNPTIFDHAIKNSAAYDDAIRAEFAKADSSCEAIFFELALQDLTRRRPVPADPPENRRSRRLGVARGVAVAGV
jgi:transaldolase